MPSDAVVKESGKSSKGDAGAEKLKAKRKEFTFVVVVLVLVLVVFPSGCREDGEEQLGEKRRSKIKRRSMRRLFFATVQPPLQFDLYNPPRELCAPFLKHRAPFVARRAPLNEVNCSKSSWGPSYEFFFPFLLFFLLFLLLLLLLFLFLVLIHAHHLRPLSLSLSLCALITNYRRFVVEGAG